MIRYTAKISNATSSQVHAGTLTLSSSSASSNVLTSSRVLVDRYPTVVGMVVTMTVRVRVQRRRLPDLLLVPGDRDPVDAAVAIHAGLALDRLPVALEHELCEAGIGAEVRAVADVHVRMVGRPRVGLVVDAIHEAGAKTAAGIIINAGANDAIVIRNVSLHGANTGLNGIRFLAGGSLVVEHCTFTGFLQNNIDISMNTANPANVAVRDTTIIGLATSLLSSGVAVSSWMIEIAFCAEVSSADATLTRPSSSTT